MRPAVFVIALLLLCSLSCGEKTEQEQQPAAETEETTIGYTSEEFSFGVYFDAEGTERTTVLEKGQTELDAYIFVHYPEGTGIAAVEFRLELPEGIKIMSDSFYEKRTLSMGSFQRGISEGFPCVYGPKLQLHRLTLGIEGEIENGVISILPAENTAQLAVAMCDEAYTTIRASSYKGVINPTE
jgi:hypothetical protein